MIEFLVKRLLISVVILFCVMFIIYALMFSMPTSYVENMARTLSQKPGALGSYTEWLTKLNALSGFDRGLVGGYFHWLTTAFFTGNFGNSWNWTLPVTQVFANCIWYSFFLMLVSFLIEISIAVPLGITAARKQYSPTDYTVTVVALVGISLPSFFVASLLKLVFAAKLQWFDISGMEGRYHNILSGWGQFWDTAAHFVLPVITLVVVGVGGWMRYTRTNMLEVLNSDYIRTARAKGLSERRVVNHHAFRNTLIPLITLFGQQLPVLFGGALITETLFAIRGIGYTSYWSIVSGDIPFTMFYLMFFSILVLVGNLMADVLYAVVDPRVRVH